ATALHLTSGMTLEAWVKPTVLSDFSSVIIKESTSRVTPYSLYASAGASAPPDGSVNLGGGDVIADGTSVLPLNAWSQLTVTFNGASVNLYVNGVLVASQAAAGSILTSTGALRIGGNSIWGEYFKGLIDEVRIYNRALSPSEVQADR